MKTRFLIISSLMIFLISSIVLTPQQTDALSCGVGPFTESYDTHDLLLHGILIEKNIDRSESWWNNPHENSFSTLVFETITVYKGEHQDQFTIKADLYWDDWYVEDEDYILFADKDGEHYLRELCIGQYIAFPQIIQFLDAYPMNVSSGIGVDYLYDFVTGEDRIKLDKLMNMYNDINRENDKQIKNVYQACEKARLAKENNNQVADGIPYANTNNLYKYSNNTHIIDSNICQWQTIEKYESNTILENILDKCLHGIIGIPEKKYSLWTNQTHIFSVEGCEIKKRSNSAVSLDRTVYPLPEEMPPLKQIKSGIPLDEIQCKGDLVQVIKNSDNSPACVTLQTKEKLMERGWTLPILELQMSIKTGTFAGECLGYCVKDFTITPEKIIYSQNGWDFVSEVYSKLPEQSKEVSISEIEWQKLMDLVDFQKFNSLPDRIGCPGCTDNLVEWIEISDGEKTKKIEFEPEDKIPEIDNLVISLREMRNTVNEIDSCPRIGIWEHTSCNIEELKSSDTNAGSHVNKIIPTLDDFKNVLSESHDIDTIFFKFGNPHDDVGSGIRIYVYELNDSTEIWIGYTDRILYVKHVDLDGIVLEDLL